MGKGPHVALGPQVADDSNIIYVEVQPNAGNTKRRERFFLLVGKLL